MERVYLHDNSKVQKVQYTQQNLFSDTRFLKKTLFGILCLFFAWQTFQIHYIFPSEITEPNDYSFMVSIPTFLFACICFYFSFFKNFTQQGPMTYKIRYFFLLIGLISLTVSFELDTYFSFMDAVDTNKPEKWTYLLIKARNESCVLLIIDALVPIWYLKLIYPCIHWIIQGIVFYHGKFENENILWDSLVSSTVCLMAIWGIKAYNDWKTFKDHSNTEAWDGVYRDIVDKVPGAIAVVDSNHKVIYSNTNFENLCENELSELSQKLIDIKKSENLTEQDQIQIDLKAFEKDDQSPNGPGDTISEARETVESTGTFLEIIDTIMFNHSKGKLKAEDYVVFNAKLANKVKGKRTNEPLKSYEIKIRPLVEYGKILLILDDITQRDLTISLETVNQYKDKLLATVSHDLRAPLNSGLIFIENTIQHEDVPKSIKEQYLIPAQRSCKFLLHLVNDILDFSQINAQKLRMAFETMPLVETIKNCHQLLEMQANFKGLSFPLVLDDKLPARFTTDHNRLAQVIINLLTNAIKFTSKGEVRLEARVISSSTVEIKVTDSGIGIKEEDKEKLFQEFTRIKYENNNINNRGVGLGLVIANRLAQRLGPIARPTGIQVESTYGEGASFSFIVQEKNLERARGKRKITGRRSERMKSISNSFTITTFAKEEDFIDHKIDEMDPLNMITSPRSPPFGRRRSIRLEDYKGSPFLTLSTRSKLTFREEKFTFREENIHREKVLIVDDNPLNVLALESVLKQHGIASDSAFNGKEAIEKILQSESMTREIDNLMTTERESLNLRTTEPAAITGRYKLIFMDYEMPVMNGFETTKALLKMMKSQEIRHIPIVGCTGHTETERWEECLKNGMVDVITKPPKREKLIGLIEKYVNN